MNEDHRALSGEDRPLIMLRQDVDYPTISMSGPNARELFHITPDRRLLFAPDIEPRDAVEAFVEWVNAALGQVHPQGKPNGYVYPVSDENHDFIRWSDEIRHADPGDPDNAAPVWIGNSPRCLREATSP